MVQCRGADLRGGGRAAPLALEVGHADRVLVAAVGALLVILRAVLHRPR